MTLPATKRDVLLTASSEGAQMTNNLPAKQTKEQLAEFHAGAAPRALVPTTFSETWRMANAVFRAGIVPAGCDSVEKVMVILMHGLEVGVSPMQALQGIALINGRPSVWGDLAIALVRSSPLCEGIKETGNDLEATCTVKRRDEDPQSRTFTKEMAIQAKLWGKSGPWQTYSARMLQMRARAWALRDVFPDVLKGLSVREEVEDYDPPRRSPQSNGGASTVEGEPSMPPTESQFITQLQVQELLALLDYSPERLRQFRVKFLDGAPLEEMRAPAFEGWKRFIQDINAKRARQATGKPAERFYREKAPNMSSEPQDASTAKSGASWDVMDQDCNEKVDPDTGEVTAPPGPTQPPVDAAGNRAPTIQEWKDKERPTQRPKPPRPVPSAAPEPSSPRAPRDGSAAKSAAAPFPPSSADLPWEDQVNALVENAPDFSMTNINALMKWQQRLFELMPDKETAAETHWEHIRERLKDIPHPANADVLQGAWNLLMKRFD